MTYQELTIELEKLETKPLNLRSKQEKIDIQELSTSKRFIDEFKDEFQSLERLSIQSGLDISGTTKTGLNVFIEVKERGDKYSVRSVSGSTMVEHTKVEEFLRYYKEDENAKLIYFQYFKNGGFISFDVTGRIKNRGSEILSYYPEKHQRNNYDSGRIGKEVHHFCFCPDNYDDVLEADNSYQKVLKLKSLRPTKKKIYEPLTPSQELELYYQYQERNN